MKGAKMAMIINSRLLKALLLVVIMITSLVALPVSPAYAADEFDALRTKIYDFTTGGPTYDPADPDIRTKITNITFNAQTNWDTMNKSSERTYLWSDMATTTESEHVSGSYQRLEAMTLAYVTRGSTLQNNPTLLADIISGMDWMYANRYNTSVPKRGYDNWFDWQVSSPLVINNITIWLYSSLTPTQISNWHAVIDYQALQWGAGLTGANRVWACNIKITSGIIVKNSAKIIEGRDQLSPVFDYVTSGEGMYSDGSFIQHTALIPYNGAYGINLIDNLTKVMYVIAGSSWDITDPNVDHIYQWIYNAFEPLFYNNSMLDMVRGRNIARFASDDKGLTSMGTLGAAVVRMALSAPSDSDREAYKSMVKKWMLEATSPTKYADLILISDIVQTKLIVNDVSVIPRAEPIMNKQYPNMARTVHFRPGFVFGIGMSSDKIGNFEIVNQENLRGWHTGDGMAYLYNSDLDQYKDSFWPTVNSYRLPGTTVNQNTTAEANAKNRNNWVGGTEILGLYGVTGMQYTANGYNLTAKKSWFMFDDEIVSLGAGITSTDNKVVETIVENRKLNSSGNNTLNVNGTAKSTTLGWSETMTGVNWVHLAGNVAGSDIGYYFPTAATIKSLRESRTDQWSSINQYYLGPDYTTDFTRNYMNLWFDHGTNPTDETYAYALLPGKSRTEVEQYSNQPDFDIVANTEAVQAVRENKLGLLGINFWQDGTTTVDRVTSNKKASVMLKTTEQDMEISVSDPTMANAGTIELAVDAPLGQILSLDPGVSLHSDGTKTIITVNVKDARGKAFKTKFSFAGTTPVLSTPTGLKISENTKNGLTISWDAVESATDYRLFRSMSAEGIYASIPDIGKGALSYTDTQLGSGVPNFYKVIAVNADEVSAYSDYVSGWTTPLPPQGLKAQLDNESAITIVWDEVSGATEYRLYRASTKSGAYQLITEPGFAASTFIDTNILSGVNYYYNIAAVNPGGVSEKSESVSSLFNIPAYAINDNFDDFELGELDGQRNWEKNTGDIAGHEIVVEADTLTNKYVRLSTALADGAAEATHTFSVPRESIVTVEETVSTCDINYKTAMSVIDAGNGKRSVNIILQSGKIWGYNGSSKVDLIKGMEFNKPYRLKAVINTSTKKFDMYVDDELIGEQWSYREGAAENLDKLVVASSGANSLMKLDQVSVAYIPLAPTNITAIESDTTSIKLSWNKVLDATGYRLYRSEDSESGFTFVGEVTNGNLYVDEGLASRTNYFYKIVSVSGGAVSDESQVLSASTAGDSGLHIPGAPSGLTASENTSSSIKLSWQAGKDATSYSVHRSTYADESYERIDSTSVLFYVDTTIDTTKEYFYKVVAENEEGVSTDSNIISSSFHLVANLVDDDFDQDLLGGHPAGWDVVDEEGMKVEVVDSDSTGGHAVRVTGGNKIESSATRLFGDTSGIVTVATLVQPTLGWKNIPVVVNSAGNPVVHVYVNTGQIYAYNTSSSKTPVHPVVYDGSWYILKVVLNTMTNKYDLYVNDVQVADQFSFRTPSTSVTGVKMAIDNVSSMNFDQVNVTYLPFTPTQLAVGEVTSSTVQLSWSNVVGASSYKVYRSTNPEGDFKLQGEVTEPLYKDVQLYQGTTYTYKVAAVTGLAVSDASNLVSVTTQDEVKSADVTD
jgi:fibronectin type 3 domain-containing protein